MRSSIRSLVSASVAAGRQRAQRASHIQQTSRRWASSSGPDKANPHREIYKSFGGPVVRVFLGALFTFQITYWAWLKLESIEVIHNKNAELAELEEKLVKAVPKSDSK